MDFVTVVLFLVLYYIRPQEWSGAFSAIHFVQIVMLTAIGTLFTRARSVRFSDLFRTPHDWMIFGFWFWLVVSAPSPWQTFKDNFNLYVFYIVIVQTLFSVPRMMKFIGWWAYLIVGVAVLALLSLVGFDPLGSRDITEGYMKGRLMLNLSIFNNPNSLGHSVVPAIPMIFYYCIWKRAVIPRVIGSALLAICFTCIYLTQSKGAFLCGGVTIVATALFGRPKTVQIIILALALMFGTSALYLLPRMKELDKAKGNEAIQGRVIAFKHGYTVLTTTWRGVGKGEWYHSFYASHHFLKASHSSYVIIGAELGYPGLFFLCGVFFVCLRTLVTARTETDDEERLRRMLFVLVLSYMVSSWMVNFEYRPTFFMFAGAIAALHRHLHGLISKDPVEHEESLTDVPIPAWKAALLPQPAQPQPALAGPASTARNAAPDTNANAATETEATPVATISAEPESEPSPPPAPVSRIGRAWNRIGLIDLGATFLMVKALVRFWAYAMTKM